MFLHQVLYSIEWAFESCGSFFFLIKRDPSISQMLVDIEKVCEAFSVKKKTKQLTLQSHRSNVNSG